MNISEKGDDYSMERKLKLSANFLMFQYKYHLFLALIFGLSSKFVVSFSNLNAEQSAKVLETFLIFVGIILLTPLFLPEQDKEIWQLEQTKKTSMWQLYAVRLILACISIVLFTLIFLFILSACGSDVKNGQMWVGCISEFIFLGAIGFFVSAVTNQVILGYMLAVMYYAANNGSRKYFGHLALFQMMEGKYDFSGYMLLASVLLFLIGILIREVRSSIH